jgi:predicted ester cyclase
MSKEEDNKAIVGRWFTEFWGKDVNLAVIDEIAAPDMLLKYSLHEQRRGREDIKAFITDFRAAFPDLNFWGTAGLIAEGDYVVGQWEGGGTHTGRDFGDFLMGSLPAATGRKMQFTGTTVLKVIDGKIVEEIGLDDGLTAMTQLGIVAAVSGTRAETRVEFDRALETQRREFAAQLVALLGRVDDALGRGPAIDQSPKAV